MRRQGVKGRIADGDSRNGRALPICAPMSQRTIARRPGDDTNEARSDVSRLTPAITFACAIACGIMVANLYYAQPLIGLIAPELHLRANVAGLIVTLTQLGYGGGLLLVVPLADRIENRKLILATLGITAVALAALAAAPSAPAFLAAATAVGFSAAGAQVVVPYAASLADEKTRGRTIGNVMSGLLAGIMLARPVASMIAEFAGWRAVFGLSSLLMLATALWMARALPRAQADQRPRLRRDPVLDGPNAAARAAVAAARAVSRLPVHDLQHLLDGGAAGTGGSLRLRPAGHRAVRAGGRGGCAGGAARRAARRPRLYPRGHGRRAHHHRAVLLAGGVGGGAAFAAAAWSLFALTLDGATQVNQVLGQRVIFSLPGEDRGRVNAVYMTIVFLLGAGGSAVATLAYHAGGWMGAMTAGTALGVIVTLLFATEWLGRARQPA